MSSSATQTRWGTLKDHLALARISNSPTVASNVLAGAALAGGLSQPGTVALLAVALVLFYTAGMYLNDLFDYEYDVKAQPGRPLVAGKVSRDAALTVAVALFGAGIFLLAFTGSVALLSGVVLIGLIVLYDAWHKTNPLSPVIMASTRVMVYVTAFLAFSLQLSASLGIWSLLLALYIIGLTYLAKMEARPGFARYWPALALTLPAIYAALQVNAFGFVLLLLFVSWVSFCLYLVYVRRSFGAAVGSLIAGISLLDALVLTVVGSTVGVVFALLAFGLTLLFQRYIKGT